MQIRDEWPADAPGIRSLLDQAFPDEPVGQLVDTLRQDGDLALSLIAEQDGEILGHIGFSPVAIAPCLSRVLQLAPLAVAEPIRRQGIGAERPMAAPWAARQRWKTGSNMSSLPPPPPMRQGPGGGMPGCGTFAP